MDIILGSTSPRRREILGFFSLPFRQVSSLFDETLLAFKGDPIAYVEQMAQNKALALAKPHPESLLLTADTVVFLDGNLFNKPADASQAKSMLRALSGKKHQVFTAVAIWHKGKLISQVERSDVVFHQLTDAQIDAYISQLAPFDKAGGFAIQGAGGLVVKRIEGCYYNVMGLPLHTTRQLLLEMGIDLWDYLRDGCKPALG